MCNCDDSQDAVRDLTKVSSALRSDLQNSQNLTVLDFDENTIAAQVSACVKATYQDGKICVKPPIIPQICFNVTLPIPSGSSVQVCMDTCGFKIGVPPFKGIKATVSANGVNLWTGTIWGTC